MPTATEQIESILQRLKEQGIRAAPFAEAMDLARNHLDGVADLAVAVMQRFPRGGTFLDAVLSFLPPDQWDTLVVGALDEFASSEENEAAASVLASASLQALPALHPHLERIFRLRPNGDAYYENWPWRDSGTIDFDRCRLIIEDPSTEVELRSKAWQAMLETRKPDVIDNVLMRLDSVTPTVVGLSAEESVEAYLEHVGFHWTDNRLERLSPPALYHLIFADEFFAGQTRPPWLERVHPTWKLEPAPQLPSMSFGGSGTTHCRACDGFLQRILILEPVPAGLGITELETLELAVCLSCLGWERPVLFYEHSSGKSPEEIGYEGPRLPVQFPAGPLRETDVRLAETPARWKWQDWALSNSRENLNRLGGEPCWVQSADYPHCPCCRDRMGFLLQLDSDLPTADGEEWLWGSGGIGYGFWCDRCKVSGFHWQCT